MEAPLLEPPRRHNAVDQCTLWSEDYFKHPQPECVPKAIATWAEGNYLNAVNLAQCSHAPVSSAVFRLSQIFRRHPENVQAWLMDCQYLPEQSMKGVLQAVWLSKTDAGAKALKIFRERFPAFAYAGKLAEQSAPDLETLDPTHPVGFHLSWSAYYATGKMHLVGNMLDAVAQLNLSGTDQGDKIRPMVESLQREARDEQPIADFVVRHCQASAHHADRVFQKLIRDFAHPAPQRPPTQFTAEQLLLPHRGLNAEIGLRATQIVNIIHGATNNTNLHQTQMFARCIYGQLSGTLTQRDVEKELFNYRFWGLNDLELSQLAAVYGYSWHRTKDYFVISLSPFSQKLS